MIRFMVLFFILLALSWCGSSSSSKKMACSIEEQNRFVYNYMKDNYLWYDQIADVDYTQYKSTQELLNDLKISKDHWSFIIDKQKFDDYFAGKGYVGFGFVFTQKGDKYYLQMVLDNSPAKEANLNRGDEIVSIDGKKLAGLDKQEVLNLLGQNKEGVTRDFVIKRGGSSYSATITKRHIDTKSVMKREIFDVGSNKVGYILFDSFIETSNQELKDAFDYFKKRGVNTLVVDLRYNGGGLVSVAQEFASLIKPEEDSSLLFSLKFNDKHREKDQDYYFNSDSSSVAGIQKVYFLTTQDTCSASEALINGLKPYMGVTVIGSKTCGKPVGMVGGEFCNKLLVPIEFKIVNSKGEGDYYLNTGIVPNCQVEDDLSHNLGDSNEAMLKQAISYISGVGCSSSSNRLYRKVDTKMKARGFESIINLY